MTKTTIRRGALLALCAGMGSTACFSERSTEPEDTAPCTGTCEVEIRDFAFAPATRRVNVGAVVRWVNDDASPHTATANDGEFDSGNMNNGDTFEWTFVAAGEHDYICEYHPSMTGTIIVE